MKLRTIALGSILSIAFFGAGAATYGAVSTGYWACLKSGNLSKVGTFKPSCAKGAAAIQLPGQAVQQAPSGFFKTSATDGSRYFLLSWPSLFWKDDLFYKRLTDDVLARASATGDFQQAKIVDAPNPIVLENGVDNITYYLNADCRPDNKIVVRWALDSAPPSGLTQAYLENRILGSVSQIANYSALKSVSVAAGGRITWVAARPIADKFTCLNTPDFRRFKDQIRQSVSQAPLTDAQWNSGNIPADAYSNPFFTFTSTELVTVSQLQHE